MGKQYESALENACPSWGEWGGASEH
jgi:hypothetical protein